MLRDNVLMYFASPKDFTGFRDKPSGIVLLEAAQCWRNACYMALLI